MRAVNRLARAGLLASWGSLVLLGVACSKEIKAEFPRPPASAAVEPPEEAPVPIATAETPAPEGEVAAAPPSVAPPEARERAETDAHRRRRRTTASPPPAEETPPTPPPSTQLARSEAPDPGVVRKLERAERLLVTADGRTLSRDLEEQLIAARAFLVQARAALEEGDERRAVVLIDKGLILAEDVERTSRP